MMQTTNFIDHLEELRKRFIIALCAVFVLGLLSFFISDFLMELVIAPIDRSIRSLYFLSPQEAFITRLKVSAMSGIVLALPVIFTQLWQFVSPGLYEREKKIVLPLVICSTVLFIFGAMFAYFVVVPLALKFFLDFRTAYLVPLISIGSYISFLLSFIITFGIMFDVPVILIGLIWLKVLGTEFLIQQRKIIVVLIFIIAAIFTPTADVLTQCIFAIPLWLLFEISVWIGKIVEAKQNQIGVPHGN